MMPLEQETKVYEANRDALLKDEGKYVVIYKDTVVGIYVDYGDALQAGYSAAKTDSFLVKKIASHDQVFFITRHILPCHT